MLYEMKLRRHGMSITLAWAYHLAGIRTAVPHNQARHPRISRVNFSIAAYNVSRTPLEA